MREPLVELEKEFCGRATSAIAEMPRKVAGLGEQVEDDVHWAYDSKLGSRLGAARRFYDLLRSAAKRCPLCLQREVAALDHYLPRETFPLLAIMPANLVPICTSCNTLKGASVAAVDGDVPLHPYFDDLPATAWLSATLNLVPGCAVTYSVRRQPGWDEMTFRRVRGHFDRLRLSELYSAEAATLLANHQVQLENLYTVAGSQAVQDLLLEMATSFRAASTDPWSALAFEVWANSRWFCEAAWRL